MEHAKISQQDNMTQLCEEEVIYSDKKGTRKCFQAAVFYNQYQIHIIFSVTAGYGSAVNISNKVVLWSKLRPTDRRKGFLF